MTDSNAMTGRIHVRCTIEERDAFIAKCRENGRVPSDIVRQFVAGYAEGIYKIGNRRRISHP